MPEIRIMSPPMVGVPFLVRRCDFRPVLADRLAFALLDASASVDHARPDIQHDEQERGDRMAPPVRNV